MSADLPIQMFDLPKGRRPTGKTVKKSVVPKDQTNVLVRMPKKLKAKLASLARADTRSLTKFIVRQLEASVEYVSVDKHGVIVQHIPAARK